MGTPILMLLPISLLLSLPAFSHSAPYSYSLPRSSSLSVSDTLTSRNRIFSAGFYPVGDNAYCFAVWFTQPNHDGNLTVIWMANRGQPVNGKLSSLSLLKTGNLILTDAAKFQVWASNTDSTTPPTQLQLHDTGNLVLVNSVGSIVWQSFDSPTNTLLPNQPLTRNTKLVSCRSETNFSSGFYSLFFDDDNLLRLLFDGPDTSSVYWPAPWLVSWEAGRTSFNNSRTAAFDSSGHFKSSDDLEFSAADYGVGIQRRLTMDVDGNVRLYSLDEGEGRRWIVSWQAIPQSCKIHGICGPNAICSYIRDEDPSRRCSCLPGYKVKNHTDWSQGCESEFSLSCDEGKSGFIQLPHIEFYGYDIDFHENSTLEKCEKACLQSCDCYAFQFRFKPENGFYNCYLKSLLLNGYQAPSFDGEIYIRLPTSSLSSSLSSYANSVREPGLDCSHMESLQLDRGYKKSKQNATLQFMAWFACAFGGVEIICICFVWFFLYRTRGNSGEKNTQGYLQVATGFRKFTYDELKKASRNFGEEIGRGGGGVVYKGVLSDHRVAAIKRLNEANQGEAEFLAEVSTIGRVNHMNLIEIWGYCVEGKHRLLVYEYMERGSLAENLNSSILDGEKRFEIAVGSAKGLAYLHEECLEWVLHCDVKPQNILLDSNYQPKVADFGLSKLLNRGGGHNLSFSTVRGTRGYMAPEWIFNLPITSKVDVYSYGVVVLEMVTGKSPMTGLQASGNLGEMEQRGLVKWVRDQMSGNGAKESWIEEIIDPAMKGRCDVGKMEILVGVALQCVEEDKDARPTMRQVIERLLHHENEEY